MRTNRWLSEFVGACVWLPTLLGCAQTARMTEAEMMDRIKGGWAGQMIGVTVGGPTEFAARARFYDKPLVWNPTDVAGATDQDDLYVEMTFARVLDEQGLDAPMSAHADAFAKSEYRLWHANFMGRLNLQNGIPAPKSGHPDFNIHADDIDFQIEADFIGLMCPGMPATSNEYCDRIGHIMNYGDGVYGGMFVAAMYAAAFFENDVGKVVEAGLAVVPTQSQFHRAVRDVVTWHRESPGDWQATWRKFEAKWANRDVCPEGAEAPYDIDAKVNAAYIAIGLLYGEGDLKKTIETSIGCGQDSDCNAASAAGILGTMRGYSWLPADWRAAMEEMQDKPFAHTAYSFRTICESTFRRAKAIVERGGGRASDGEIVVLLQRPRRAPLEQWKQDRIAARLKADDPRLAYTGEWKENDGRRESGRKGDRVELIFEGTGAMIIGTLCDTNGYADVLLDGRPQRRVNLFYDHQAYPRASVRKHESVFHVMGLPRGRHTLTVVVTGEKPAKAKDSRVNVGGAVIFDGPEEP